MNEKQEWYCKSSQSRASNLVTCFACFSISEFEHLRPRRFQLCSQINFPRSWVPGCLSLEPIVEQWNTFFASSSTK